MCAANGGAAAGADAVAVTAPDKCVEGAEPAKKGAPTPAKIVSGETTRVEPKEKALILAATGLPDRSIRSPWPATELGLKLKIPPKPPMMVFPDEPVLPLTFVVPNTKGIAPGEMANVAPPSLIRMPPPAASMFVVTLLALPLPMIVSPGAPITAFKAPVLPVKSMRLFGPAATTTFWSPPSAAIVFCAAATIVALPPVPATTVVPDPVTTICWVPLPATIESLVPPQIDSLLMAPPITVSLPASALRICEAVTACWPPIRVSNLAPTTV